MLLHWYITMGVLHGKSNWYQKLFLMLVAIPNWMAVSMRQLLWAHGSGMKQPMGILVAEKMHPTQQAGGVALPKAKMVTDYMMMF